MKTIGLLLALLALPCLAESDLAGKVSLQLMDLTLNHNGPLARAAALNPDVSQPAAGITLETELSLNRGWFFGMLTLQVQKDRGREWLSDAWFNELYMAGTPDFLPGVQFSVGKKIVSWDVGYAFRPNDLVQQEDRRSLLPSTLTGHSVLMAEYFPEQGSVALVLANPQSHEERGADEPALLARGYMQAGGLDLYAFTRQGRHSGFSLGAAASWVAGDSLELHGSARWINRSESLVLVPPAGVLAQQSPWQIRDAGHSEQLLLGGTWTNAAQLSVLAEAWWDGTAMSDAKWNQWFERSALRQSVTGMQSAVAGNTAWEAEVMNKTGNLRRGNTFVRVSQLFGPWSAAMDVLYHPADRGAVVTATLQWQGDHIRVQTGWRGYGGPAEAVYSRVPVRQEVYVLSSYSW